MSIEKVKTYGLKLLFVLLLGLPVKLVYPGTPIEDKQLSNKIFQHIYNFEFQEAEQLIAHGTLNSFYRQFLDTDLLWWKAISSNDPKDFDNFRKGLLDKNKPDKLKQTSEGKAISKSYEIRYYLAKQNYLMALIEYASLRHIQKEFQTPEKCSKQQEMIINFYTISFRLLEEEFVKEYFGKRKQNNTDELLGKIELMTKEDDLIINTISRYFLYKYYTEVEPDKNKAFILAWDLHRQFPQNTIFKDFIQKSEINFTNN